MQGSPSASVAPPTPTPPPAAADQQWATFVASLPAGDPIAVGVYNGPMALLADAIRAYHVGALGAAVVTCRSAIESACFIVMTTMRYKAGGYSYSPPNDLSGKLRNIRFAESLKAVSDHYLLPEDVLKRVRELQEERGNFVAHLAARQLKEMIRAAREPPTPGGNWMRLWVSPEEVAADIELTETVIRAMIERTRDRIPTAGP
jgi:hypothetical protein